MSELVALAGRARQRLRRQAAPRLGRIIAAEVGRLAHFGKRIVKRLAAFRLQQSNQSTAVRFEMIGRAVERSSPPLNGRRIPRRKAGLGRCECRAHDRLVTLSDHADHAAIDRRGDRAQAPRNRNTVDERPCFGICRHALAHLRKQTREAFPVPELDARRIFPFRPIEIAGPRNLRMARMARVADDSLRALQDGRHRHAGIGRRVDERRIGAVLQQAADQIGEQVAMAADRCINTASRLGLGPQQGLVERFAHAIEPLELVARDPAGGLDGARDGQGIVGRELRIDPRPRGKQLVDADHVAEIGHRLAREHRVIGEAAFLGALDLGIPIGALHQAHHEMAAVRAGSLDRPVDHRRRSLLIRLHRKPEAVPPRKRRISESMTDDIEGELEPIRLFGINGEIEVMGLCGPRQLDHARGKLSHHAPA